MVFEIDRKAVRRKQLYNRGTYSAQFSETAWAGRQLENYVICDDKECYDVYMQQFIDLRDNHCGNIAKHSVFIDEDSENIDELPIMKQINKQGVMLIDVSDVKPEDVEYGFFMKKAISDMAKLLARPKHDKNGLIEIKADKAKKIAVTAKKNSKEKKEMRREYPQFVLDWENCTVVYNNHLWDLDPDQKDVEHDAKLLAMHMAGFNSKLFVGDVGDLRIAYWKVLNYMFLSPFIAKIRYDIGNDDWLRFVPMYLLLCGESDAGKTRFVQLVQKMMFNEKRPFLKGNYFSPNNAAELKVSTKGYPIIIDELTSSYWKYANDIVKNDIDLIENHMINHSCFILICNHLNNVKPEITKRVMIINPECRMNSDEATRNHNKLTLIQNNMTNALYRRYIAMMFERLPKVLGQIRTKMPDVWNISSIALHEIFSECGVLQDLPIQTWEDYTGQKMRSDRALKILIDEWNRNSDAFKVNKKYNQLCIDFSMHEQKECEFMLSVLCDELPATFECKRLGSIVTLNLAKTESFMQMNFKSKRSVLSFGKFVSNANHLRH